MNSSVARKTAALFPPLILLGSWWPSPSGAGEPAVPVPGPHGLEFARIDGPGTTKSKKTTRATQAPVSTEA